MSYHILVMGRNTIANNSSDTADLQTYLFKGKVIARVRPMSDIEMIDYDFNTPTTVIVFTDGSELFPANNWKCSDGGIFVYSPE